LHASEATKEIKKIIGKIRLKGYTLIALSLYFNQKNIAKVELGIAKGKKLHDKIVNQRIYKRKRLEERSGVFW